MACTATMSDSAGHPGWLRLIHWLNALAVLIMIASGWRIYNASPLFGFSFPQAVTNPVFIHRTAPRRAG